MVRNFCFWMLGWLLLGSLALGAGPQPVLVKDLQEGLDSPSGGVVELKAALGQRLFYTAFDWAHGNELWTSDGTVAGTRMVKDIHPGPGSSEIREMVASGNRVFFSARDHRNSHELWVSDGTAAGTRMVVQLTVDPSRTTYPVALRAYDGGVFFVGESGAWTGLWKSDGTAAGTTVMKVLGGQDAGFSYHGLAENQGFVVLGSSVYFSLLNELSSYLQLWKVDGTATGTLALTDPMQPDAADQIQGLGVIGKSLYFSNGHLLWRTNGTPEGTHRVIVSPGTEPGTLKPLLVMGGKGYLLSGDGDNKLWVVDGGAAGPRAVQVQTGYPEVNEFQAAAAMSGLLVLTFDRNGNGVWVYNPASKKGLTVFEAEGSVVSNLVALGKRAFFVVTMPGAGASLWVTDGTVAGTKRHCELPGADLVLPQLKATATQVFFSRAAVPGQHGSELWCTDGTEAGLKRVMESSAAGRDGDPQHLRTAAGALYFAAADALHGRELWRSDGTAGGTVRVADIRPGVEGSSPEGFCEVNGVVYFSADDGSTGAELWRTDGTEAGTWRVKDIFAGGAAGQITDMRAFGGRLFFEARKMPAGRALWVTDGTEAGTEVLSTLSAGGQVASVRHLVEFDGALYFAGFLNSRWRLCRTQGVPGDMVQVGTEEVVSSLVVRPPTPGAAWLPEESVLFFTASVGVGETGLYVCREGEGPELLQSFGGFSTQALMLAGSGVVWGGYDGPESEVWTSDGTPAGTVKAVDNAGVFATTGEKVYLWQSDGQGLGELWVMNADGSDRAFVLAPAYGAGLTLQYVEGETVFFSVSNGLEVAGKSLWQTRGSPETTREIGGAPAVDHFQDGWKPYPMQRLGERLYFTGFQPEVGRELFSLDLKGSLKVESLLSGQVVMTLAEGQVMEVGAQPVGVVRVEKLRLRNTGALPLTGVTLSAPALSDYGLSETDVGSLAGGASVEVEVAFTPQVKGLRETQVVISGVAGTAVTQTVRLRGLGLDAADAPVALQGPGAHLVLEGEDVELAGAGFASAVPLTYAWFHGTTALPEETEATLLLPAVQRAQGGTYTLKATGENGVQTSPAGEVAVVVPLPEAVVLPEGGTLSLRCEVGAAATAVLGYQWLHEGLPLVNANRVQGAQSAQLQISGLRPENVGDYSCVVTMTTALGMQTVNAGTTALTLEDLPRVVVPLEGLTHFVNQPVEYQVELSAPASRLTVTGLPPGLKMSPAGLVTGRPTAARPVDPGTGLPAPYVVRLTATPAAGVGETVLLFWRIHPLLPPGGYDGLLERNADLDGGRGLGSQLKVVVTGAGSISGQLTLGGKVYRFAKGLLLDVEPVGGVGSLEFLIPQGRGLDPLRLVLTTSMTLNSTPFYFDATLSDAGGASAMGQLFSPAFTPARPAGAQVGNHTWLMSPMQYGLDENIPDGPGYMTATVSKTGVVNWRGKMADGTVMTGSSLLALGNEGYVFALRKDLYGATGSVQGWLRMQGAEVMAISGSLDWMKAALPENSKTRLYKAGIPLHFLSVTGGTYVPPVAGERVLALEAGENNALLILSGQPVPGGSVRQRFTVTEKNRAPLPPPSLITPLRSFSFALSQGTFKGSIQILDPNPVNVDGPPLRRIVAFEGAILPGQGMAEGFALVPAEPAGTPPIRACRVVFRSTAAP